MAQKFEDALIVSDDAAACQSLHGLLSQGTIAKSPTLPATARAYLEAYCDVNRAVARRRWTGLALARLIDSRPEVVPLLRQAGDLVRIGAVVLAPNVAEELRIVAGLVIRAGLSQGIKFAEFWSLEKVHGTASLFPEQADIRWMRGFQDYLDALSSQIPFGGSSSGLSVLYPIALIAADDYKWAPPGEERPILLIERQTITIVTSESALYETQFVYIPKRSIRNARCRPCNTYDSQDRHAEVAPWEVLLEFMPDSTYQVNCSYHSSTDFTIIMEHKQDAEECVSCINEIMFPRGNSSEEAVGSDSALGEAPNQKKHGNGVRTISKGEVIGFDRSKHENNTSRGSQQSHQPASDTADGARPNSAQTKRGTLPVVKKPSSLGGKKLSLHTTNADFEFPDCSPSIKRPAPAKGKKPMATRKGATSSQISETKVSQKAAAPRSKARSQEVVDADAYDLPEAENDGDPLDSGPMLPAKQKSKPSTLSKVSKPIQGQASKARRQQSDVFSLPQETQEDKSGTKRGTKRTRAQPVTYKEDSTSEDGASDPEFVSEKQTRKPRVRAAKTTEKETTSSSTKSLATDRKSRKSKSSKQPQSQPLKESLLSNLLPKPSAKGTQKSRAGSPSEAAQGHEPRVTDRRKLKADIVSTREQENPSSEAQILGRLNDEESDDSAGDTVQELGKNGAASRKRPAGSPTPSTPRSKRTRLDHDTHEMNAEVGDLMFVKPPPTIAPLRVLQEPSSPCGSRSIGSMQAPPKPTSEESMRVLSPKKQRGMRSQHQIDERQTPVHQLGKRSHSGMSANMELLSSNSKPTPASPHAASTAISGHADRHQVTMDKELGEYRIEKSDPFAVKSQRRDSEFTRKLARSRDASQKPEAQEKRGISLDHPIELGDSPSSTGSSSSQALPPTKQSPMASNDHTGITQPVELLQIREPEHTKRSRSRTMEHHTLVSEMASARPSQREHQVHQTEAEADMVNDAAEMEGDTLVDFEESQLPGDNTLAHLRSSPPPMDDSPSSHSSTSAEPEPKTDPPVPSPEAEEMEWEASLQPYQRDLKDQLLRVSGRVLRHVVDNESAVDEIANTYAKDGQHSLNLLLEKHEQEFGAMRKNIKQKKTKMNKASEKMMSKLRREREEILADEE